MAKQALNPYLPSWEYVPDGEPHVFGDRLYVFGSHDRFGGSGFCQNDYVCWSAPVTDLTDWRFDGVIYKKEQDPANPEGRESMNAPDVVQGPDGRYYLYYQLTREMYTSVAAADRPEGPYAYYGAVKHADGTLYGKGKQDAFAFDPGLLKDDDGRLYLYVGFSPDRGWLRTVLKLRGGRYDGGYVVELGKDMLTVIGEQTLTVPGEAMAKGTEFEGHGFYEASSPRKIHGVYYLVYSSALSHELCCATAPGPRGPWKYGGTLVSIADIGLEGVTKENPRNFTGNTHGGMVCVGGQWYIFYHRQTNRQKCCRQGCAEPIAIEADGSIRQAEITSCGLNGGPLEGTGTYEARIACNLSAKNGTYAYVKTIHRETQYPYFTQSGGDREGSPDQYIANMRDGAWCAFKYFRFHGENRISVSVRGTGKGTLDVAAKPGGAWIAKIPVSPSENWTDVQSGMLAQSGVRPLYFTFRGTGALDFRSFTLDRVDRIPREADGSVSPDFIR